MGLTKCPQSPHTSRMTFGHVLPLCLSFPFGWGPAELSLSPADTLARYTLSWAGEETESEGHSEHCGSAACEVWGKTQHQGGKSPTERGMCHRTGPDCLLLALTASHSGATWTQGQELLLPGDRHQTSLFLVGLQQPHLWDRSDYSHVPTAEQGPWQLGQGLAWTCRAIAGAQHLCPPHRNRGRYHPNLLPTSLCQGGPLYLRGCHPCGWWAQIQGQTPALPLTPSQFPWGWGCLPCLSAADWGPKVSHPKAAAQPRSQSR